jgi:putative transcriptional regulator
MISNHPSSELLIEYSAASMATAPSIAVTTHLQFCDKCQQATQSLNQIGGELLEASLGTSVSEDSLEELLRKVSDLPQETADESQSATKSTSSTDRFKQALPTYVQGLFPPNDLDWRSVSKSVQVATMRSGETSHELALHRISAGGETPKHRHTAQEITVVLTGCFSDENGVYQPGDFLVREQGEVHRPSASQNEECICLSVLAGPIKLTGLKQILNPFLKFSPK